MSLYVFKPILESDSKKIILQLKNKYSCGINNISSNKLKDVSNHICQVVNKSVCEEIFSNNLK